MEITKKMVYDIVVKGNERLAKGGYMNELVTATYNKVKDKTVKDNEELKSIVKKVLNDNLKEDKPMTLKELLAERAEGGRGLGPGKGKEDGSGIGKGGKGLCGKPDENLKKYGTYKKYTAAMTAKFGKPFPKFSKEERKALDAGWKAKDE